MYWKGHWIELVSRNSSSFCCPAVHLCYSDVSDLVVYLVHSDSTEHVHVFAANILPPAEREYSAVVWEALEWAIGECFCGDIMCSAQALTTILTLKWTDFMNNQMVSAHNVLLIRYTIKENKNTDCLSRLPLPQTGDSEDWADIVVVFHLSGTSNCKFNNKALCADWSWT